MRAELPWNVAGIPPEAREAARAAARREGLSVGEWLTRRILRDLSDLAELEDDESGAAKRRDTEEMLAQLAEAEAEATNTYRRIEQKLRLVGTDYDNAERNQSESNRAMSRAANEIHTAGREQAEAFGQLGRHLTGLEQRLDRLERSSGQEGLKEAVKGLHQGLSRLASELGQASGRSGVQIASLARNLEQLALRLVAVRGDGENAAKLLDARLALVEEAHHVTADAIDRAVEKLDDEMARRAEILTEADAREGEWQAALTRIEERLGRIEGRALDPALAQRLDDIEQTASQDRAQDQALTKRLDDIEQTVSQDRAQDQALTQRLDEIEQTVFQDQTQDQTLAQRLDEIDQSVSQVVATLEQAPDLTESLARLSARLETVEKNHQGMLLDLSARLSGLATAMAEQRPVPETPAPFLPEPPDAKPLSPERPGAEQPETEMEVESKDAAPFEDVPLSLPITEDLLPAADDLGDDAFATHFEMPEDLAQALARPSEDVPPAAKPSAEEEENFLKTAARLSAMTASEPEAEKLRVFPWRAAESEGGSRRHPVLLAGALLLLLAAAAAMMVREGLMEQRVPAKLPVPAHKIAPKHGLAAAKASPPLPSPGVMAPITPGANTDPTPQSPAPTAKGAAPSDKVLAAANGGNPAAETVIGLRYLDSLVSDPAKAAPWLERAAQAGQPVAEYRLGTLYERGQGVAENPALAVKWYLAAAEQGNRKAMHNLAVAYADGAAGPKNMAEAARWFTKAASLGLSDSQFNLAVLYERGDGVPQSLADAYKWYAIAAAQGDAESKARLLVLRTQLSASDRAAAERAAKNFRAQALDSLANLPPDPRGLGG